MAALDWPECPAVGASARLASGECSRLLQSDGVVLRVLDQRQISIDVSAYQRPVRIRGPAYQSGHVLIGSAAPRAFDSATDRTRHDGEHRHTTIEATSAFTIPL